MSRDFRAGNNPRTLDTNVTTTAHDMTLNLIPGALAFYAHAFISAPSANTDVVYFRLNGPVADSTNGESLSPGEVREVIAYIRSISVISASGTQTIEVEGRG